MRTWFDSTARAIDDDAALRPYAILLSLVHALTGVAWFTYKNVAELASGEDCVCWPLWPDCYRLRPHLTPEAVRDAVLAYVAIGLAAAALFALHRARAALATFAVATVAGTLLYSLDYRLRLNQTYMFGWIVLAFLFAPARKKALVVQALVALFYFWAGTLKLNAEWVSGAALYAKPFLVPAALVPAACVYVLVLEMVFVWGLFSRRPRVRAVVYAQLLVFHAVSWNVVGYFYPLVMFALTAIYPLVWLRTPGEGLTMGALRSDPEGRRSLGVVAAVFSVFQLVPHLFPGDTAVTGEGRLFALHMFDAQTECEGGAILTRGSGQRSRAALINEHQDTRSHCDPIVLVAQAQRLCRLLAAHGDAARVDVAIDAKRTTDRAMQPLVHVNDFCQQEIDYSVWHHNAWIGR
jgi:hypothetical protein